MMCFILVLLFVFIGCNTGEETPKDKQENAIDEKINNIKLTKGSSINYEELNFISNKNDLILLYGDNYKTKYANESLNTDTSLIACDYNSAENLGKMYTLKEAYEQNYISKNDLMDIYNNYINYNEKLTLDKEVELKILNDSLVSLKTYKETAKLEDVFIYGYYDKYNNAYIVRLTNTFKYSSAVVKELKIDDIVFEYSDSAFLVWLMKKRVYSNTLFFIFYY